MLFNLGKLKVPCPYEVCSYNLTKLWGGGRGGSISYCNLTLHYVFLKSQIFVACFLTNCQNDKAFAQLLLDMMAVNTLFTIK